MKKLWLCTLSLFSLLLVGCNNGDSGLVDAPNGLDEQAVKLVVTPKNAQVPIGLTQQMRADAELSSGKVIDVTDYSAVTWSSSDESKAVVDNQGVVSGVNEGSVTVTAVGVNKDGSEVRDSAVLQITDAVAVSLTVTPKNNVLSKGLIQTYKAEALLSDGRAVDVTTNTSLTWSSSDTTVAGIDGVTGVAIALETGETTITASGKVGEITLSDSATLMVGAATISELKVSPDNASIPVGLDKVYSVNAILSDKTIVDVTEQATWTTSDASIATVSDVAGSKGKTTGVNVSSFPAVITASVKVDGVSYSDTAELTVTDAVVSNFIVSPDSASIPIGRDLNIFQAKATLSDGQTIDVTKNDAVSWSTSDAKIATVDNGLNKGGVTAVSEGSVTITATGLSGSQTYTSSSTVTVTAPVMIGLAISPESDSVPIGIPKAFKAVAIFSDNSTADVTSDASLSWSSSDNNIASISNASTDKGTAKGVTSGSVTITATDNVASTPITATAELEITPAIITKLDVNSESIPKGATKQLTAIAEFSDNHQEDVTMNSNVSWSSDDASIMTVSNDKGKKGVAIGVELGVTNAVATLDLGSGNIVAGVGEQTVTELVIKSVEVAPGSTTVVKGTTVNLKATATLSDDSLLDITDSPNLHWTSDNTAVATVNDTDKKGEVTGVEDSSTPANIIATFDSFSDGAEVYVTEAAISSFVLNWVDKDYLVEERTRQVQVLATLSNGDTNVDITNDRRLTWSIDDTSLAELTFNDGELKGAHYGDTATLTVSGNFTGGPKSQTLPIKVIPYYTAPFLKSEITSIPEADVDSIYVDKDGLDTTSVSAVNVYAAASQANGVKVCSAKGGLLMAQDAEHLENYLRDRNNRTDSGSTAQGKLGEKWPKEHMFWTGDVDETDLFEDYLAVGWEDGSGYITRPQAVLGRGVIMCENQ